MVYSDLEHVSAEQSGDSGQHVDDDVKLGAGGLDVEFGAAVAGAFATGGGASAGASALANSTNT
ncbi:hypothetical protein BGZ79_002747, partial [Entomortierella chlamydospora]